MKELRISMECDRHRFRQNLFFVFLYLEVPKYLILVKLFVRHRS